MFSLVHFLLLILLYFKSLIIPYFAVSNSFKKSFLLIFLCYLSFLPFITILLERQHLLDKSAFFRNGLFTLSSLLLKGLCFLSYPISTNSLGFITISLPFGLLLDLPCSLCNTLYTSLLGRYYTPSDFYSINLTIRYN